MRLKWLFVVLVVIMLGGCGASGPSESDVKSAIQNTMTEFNDSTMGLGEVKITNIVVGDSSLVSGTKDTYEVEVTTTAEIVMLGKKTTKENSAVVKVRKINDKWVLIQ